MGATHGAGAPWCLRLDAPQANALRHIFLRLFWHDAVDEGWTGGKQLTFRPPAERPFDVPRLVSTATVRLVAANTRLETVRGGFVHLTSGSPPTATPERLWTPASGDHHEALARLRRDGAEVAWTSRDLPDLVVGKVAGAALLPGSRARMHIELNAAQIGDAVRLLSQSPSWRFGVDVRLGDHADPGLLFHLPGAAVAVAIEREQSIETGNVSAAELRAVPQTTPVTWPAPQPLALSVRYRWTVIPPALPTGADEDALVGRWRTLDSDWRARLGKASEALQEAEQHRGRIRAAFTRLINAMLGLERTHMGLRKELEALAARTPSAEGPRAAAALLDRITAIEGQVRTLQGELEETERKAREEQEREKQHGEWKVRVQKATQELAARRAALVEQEGRRTSLATELAEVAAALQCADEDVKNAPDTGATKNERAAPGAKKGQDQKASKDLLARQRRTSDELAKVDRELKRLQTEFTAFDRQATEQFEFKPPARPIARAAPGTGRFVPASGPSRPANAVPDEALPEVGDLRHHRGQRFLVIDHWEALELGESAALRLKARLVAPENT